MGDIGAVLTRVEARLRDIEARGLFSFDALTVGKNKFRIRSVHAENDGEQVRQLFRQGLAEFDEKSIRKYAKRAAKTDLTGVGFVCVMFVFVVAQILLWS